MVDENRVHRNTEQFRHSHGKRKAGIIFIGFNRVDGLTRDPQSERKFALTKVFCQPKLFEPVFQPLTLHDPVNPHPVKSSLQGRSIYVQSSLQADSSN